MLQQYYLSLIKEFEKFLPTERIFSDQLRTLAYGTDASFYRLTPKIVVKVKSEEEVIFVVKKCNEFKIPITFRASGTSLSGQSISDSVLMVADRSWNLVKISEDRSKVTIQPAALGGRVNLELIKYNRKIGPDPASINAAAVCGIASNNASGMTSGVKYNSYNTVADMRIVFANGAILNTADGEEKIKFIEQNRELIVELLNIAWDINKKSELVNRINKKYSIKNTTGYSINSFVDFKDPIEIIKHLMIGSEGTLGFISQITFNTVISLPYKATSLILFPDVKSACDVIPKLKLLEVDAAEIMDRASLRSVENKKGLPEYLIELDERAAALLIETSAISNNKLLHNIESIRSALSSIKTVRPIEFTSDPKEYLKLWNVRKGLFPSVSKSRPEGTTVVIEDVNFETSKLADAVNDLKSLFIQHGYENTIIWGHALSGNIHFVFAQDFNKSYEINRYQKFMNDVVQLVIEKYDGSLKAEHGTGRNMAPFVKYEWGSEIYEFMIKIKNAFDPNGILNPGVLINSDKEVHLKNLKPTPVVNSIIDKCIDCGFCENVCPSKNLTLTPRQRITVWREIGSLETNNKEKKNLQKLEKQFNYYGDETCATDGLCELSCPVDIDTGKLIKEIRSDNASKIKKTLSKIIASNFSLTVWIIKKSIKIINIVNKIFGETVLININQLIRKVVSNNIPLWNKFLPKASKTKFKSDVILDNEKAVVYFPSCISRTMGKYSDSEMEIDQAEAMQQLLGKAGYKIIYPKKLNSLCCGMPFASKGLTEQSGIKAEELYKALMEVSKNNEIPMIFDTSPCSKTFRSYLKIKNRNLNIYDSVEFIADKLLDNLAITKKEQRIAIHSTCSTTKMDLTDKLITIAKKCASEVYIPEDVTCCGFAGDRGFSHPELNESALINLQSEIKKQDCKSGYSSSRTCEIGLSLHSGIEYNSIIQLVNECSTQKNSDSN
ncbi:MAG: FAD-binding oxidoreductase [Ignavibacteriales bacterium]|nr:FAD-binding oxidoreductase [Ignavibacteriales bacterium]